MVGDHFVSESYEFLSYTFQLIYFSLDVVRERLSLALANQSVIVTVNVVFLQSQLRELFNKRVIGREERPIPLPRDERGVSLHQLEKSKERNGARIVVSLPPKRHRH